MVREDPSLSSSHRKTGFRFRFLSVQTLGFLKEVAKIRQVICLTSPSTPGTDHTDRPLEMSQIAWISRQITFYNTQSANRLLAFGAEMDV